MAPQAKILVGFHWFCIGFSIENMIYECENAQIFACGALECCKSSKKRIKPLIFVKIGAEFFWGFWEFIIPPLIKYQLLIRGEYYK